MIWRNTMILNIRIDHKTADIGKIEESHKMDEIFTKIQEDHEIQEHVQIKTCNRAEIYLVMDDSPLKLSLGWLGS